MQTDPVAVIGAGPAGLAAAHELAGQGFSPLVLERTSAIGGLARTGGSAASTTTTCSSSTRCNCGTPWATWAWARAG